MSVNSSKVAAAIHDTSLIHFYNCSEQSHTVINLHTFVWENMQKVTAVKAGMVSSDRQNIQKSWIIQAEFVKTNVGRHTCRIRIIFGR